ncbi:DUF6541 family protein [Microbacterium terregens]|uniref:DUF6541 family protein n=1 Tax=Microbacterium terregens TaxID=69363 RepID=A0ABV5SZM6_9MICO
MAVVGGALCWGVGLRGFSAIAIAPAAAVTVIGVTAVASGAVGIPWSVFVVIVASAVIGVVLWILRRRVFAPAPRGARHSLRVDTGLLAGLSLAVCLICWRVLTVIGGAENISQSFDNVFHLNALRYVLDTGNASSLMIGRMTNPAGGLGFYPAGWHGLTSLVVQVSGVSIPVAVNAVTVVTAAVIWPLGAILLARALLGSGAAVSIAAGVLAAAFPSFPLLVMDYGVLYPYQLGLALVPVALTATLRALGLAGDRGGRFPTWWWWVILAGAIPGIAIAHPGAFVSWVALSFPMAVAYAWLQWRASRSSRARWAVAVGSVVYLGAGLLVLIVLRPPLDARGWPLQTSMLDAVWRVLSVSIWYSGSAVLAALAVVLGLLWAVIRPSQQSLIAVGMFAVAAILFVVVAALPLPQLRDLLTGSWYNNLPRLAAMLPLASVPLGAYGVSASCDWLAGRWRTPRTRASSAGNALANVIIAVAIVAGVVGTQVGAMNNAVASAQSSFRLDEDSALINSDEWEILARLDEHVPPGVFVAGNPYTGASLAYALADRPVLMPHILMEVTDDIQALNDGLASAGSASAACDAVNALNVGFVLDFGRGEVHGADHTPPGFVDLAESDAVTEVDREGDASLYKIVACQR